MAMITTARSAILRGALLAGVLSGLAAAVLGTLALLVMQALTGD